MERQTKKRKKWYQRSTVSKINLDWTKLYCKNVTQREMELLKIVNYRKLVRRDHLEVIHPDYRNLKYSTKVLNRSLNKLFELHCIDKVHEEAELFKGNLPQIVSLDRAGAILLDIPFKRRIIHQKRLNSDNKTDIIRKLPSTYRHINGINQLEVDTIHFCKDHDFELLVWNIENTNKRSFSYNEDITLIPDVFLIMSDPQDNPYIFYIEYDTGSEDRRNKTQFPVLRDKFEKYRKFMISRAWQRDWWYQDIGMDIPFPIIIFVTEDEKRIPYIREQSRKLGVRILPCLVNEYKDSLEDLIIGH